MTTNVINTQVTQENITADKTVNQITVVNEKNYISAGQTKVLIKPQTTKVIIKRVQTNNRITVAKTQVNITPSSGVASYLIPVEMPHADFDYTASQWLLGKIPANSHVYLVTMEILLAFSGTVSITVGTLTAQGLLMVALDNDPERPNIYRADMNKFFPTLTELYVFVSGISLQGQGNVLVHYNN